MKKLWVYIILALFISESAFDSIKIVLSECDSTEMFFEFDQEESNSDKEKKEKKEDLKKMFLSNQSKSNFEDLTLQEDVGSLDFSYETILRSVPTPPPDNILIQTA